MPTRTPPPVGKTVKPTWGTCCKRPTEFSRLRGQLKGRQIIEAKRLIEKRLEHGPASPNRDQIKPPTSSYSPVRTYQREVERQRKMVLKAEHAHQRLLLVVQGLKKLFADEHFVNLLRAEGLDTLPKYLAERINTLGAVTNPITPGPEGATP